jgi:hypothetical protein
MTPWQWERPDAPYQRLKLLREHFGLSAAAASIAVGFSDQSWRDWENKNELSAKNALLIAMRFERDGDAARDLAHWLLAGGPMPKRPEPPLPFAPSRSAQRLAKAGASSYNRCCMSAQRVA